MLDSAKRKCLIIYIEVLIGNLRIKAGDKLYLSNNLISQFIKQ